MEEDDNGRMEQERQYCQLVRTRYIVREKKIS